MNNYLTDEEMNAIKGLVHYLNNSFSTDINALVTLVDSNGDPLGSLTSVPENDRRSLNTEDVRKAQYVYQFPS